MSSIISLAFCLDDNYVEQVSAVIRSIQATNPHNQFDIYLVFNNLSSASQAQLKQFESNNITLCFKPTEIIIDGVGPSNHVSNATFVKFEIIKVLAHLDKVLYLDGDIIVLDDLLPLWQKDVSQHYLGGVENPFSDRNEALGMKPDSVYFNAGILLLNLKKMRETDFHAKAHAYIQKNPSLLIFHDQDVFNHLVDGNYLPLSERYNFQTFFIRMFERFSSEKQSQVKASYQQVVIMHYSSGIKPWFYFDPHPRAKLFRQYYRAALRLDRSESAVRQAVRYIFVKLHYLKNGLL